MAAPAYSIRAHARALARSIVSRRKDKRASMDITLASQSPRRREILSQLGVHYRVHSADIAEVHERDESATDYVLRLASTKAQVVAQRWPDQPVLGADTIGVCRGQILEKPTGPEHAKAMLRAMSDTTHQVITGVAIVHQQRLLTAVSVTDVRFRALSEAEMDAYWLTGEPQDKSGGYAIQGKGAVFVESINGSYSNVVGLPIEVLVPLLKVFAVPIWQTSP